MESSKSLMSIVVKEERVRKKAYFVTSLVLQAIVILSLIPLFTLSLSAFLRDYDWNKHLSSELRNVSQALVIKDDLILMQNPGQVRRNLADDMFMKAIKSSDLPVTVLSHPEYSQLSYRETSMQVLFIVVVSILALGLSVQLFIHLCVKSRWFHEDKWCLITYVVAAVLLVVGTSFYIRSWRQSNENYIQMANLIRREAIELTGLQNPDTVSETLHSCQIRAIVQGQSAALQSRLAARKICDFQYIKLITCVIAVMTFLLMITLMMVIAWCHREPKTLKDELTLGNKISMLSLYIDLSPEDFRRAGFPYGDDDESSHSSGSATTQTTPTKDKKDNKNKRKGSTSSGSSSTSYGSNSSFTFGNRKKIKHQLKLFSKGDRR